MSASADDPDGSIAKVEFFNGTALLGTDSTAPYTFNWSNVPAGTYSLSAKATDNLGAEGTSSSITVTVMAAPPPPPPPSAMTDPISDSVGGVPCG